MPITEHELHTLTQWLNQKLQQQMTQILSLVPSLTSDLADDPDQLEDLTTIDEAANDLLKLIEETQLQTPSSVDVRRYLHDVRNPLGAVFGFSEFLIDNTPHLKVQRIYQISMDAIYCTDCVATYIKIKTHEFHSPSHPIYVNLVQEINEMMDSRPNPNAQVALSTDLPTLRLDRQQLEYLLASLWYIANTLTEGPVDVFALDDAHGPVRVSMCFPSAVMQDELRAPLDTEWTIPSEVYLWQVALHTTIPIVEGHKAGLEVYSDAHMSQLLLDLPFDHTDPVDSSATSSTVSE